jgi:hypothetical protein
MRWTVPLLAVALVVEEVVAGPRIRKPFGSLVDVLPAWAVDLAYEAMARGLHVAVAATGALMLATALAMAAILRHRPPADRERPDVQFRTRGLNSPLGATETSRDAEGSDGGRSARERLAINPCAAGRRRTAEIPAAALRSPAGPA